MKKKIVLSLMITLFATTTVIQAANVRYLSFEQTAKSMDKDLEGAARNTEDPYFIISSITAREIGETEVNEKVDLPTMTKDLGSVIAAGNKLIAFGTKVWTIIKKGKPVVSVDMGKPISILPKSDDPNEAFLQMENWSAPKAKRYRVEYKNMLGMAVIAFDYTVQFQYNGQYDGTGKYVTGLQVNASNVAVSWGYTFDASSELRSISNRGRLDNPIAAGTIQINYHASTVLRDISSTETFHVTGTGEVLKY